MLALVNQLAADKSQGGHAVDFLAGERCVNPLGQVVFFSQLFGVVQVKDGHVGFLAWSQDTSVQAKELGWLTSSLMNSPSW